VGLAVRLPVRRNRLKPTTCRKEKLLGWRHPGFSAHVGEPIPPNDARAIEDMASCLVRNPLSLKRLVYG
jgi:hypothetical protein